MSNHLFNASARENLIKLDWGPYLLTILVLIEFVYEIGKCWFRLGVSTKLVEMLLHSGQLHLSVHCVDLGQANIVLVYKAIKEY